MPLYQKGGNPVTLLSIVVIHGLPAGGMGQGVFAIGEKSVALGAIVTAGGVAVKLNNCVNGWQYRPLRRNLSSVKTSNAIRGAIIMHSVK